MGKWEDSAEYGGQVREMKYRAKSNSPLGPSSTMAEQLVHVPFSSQDRDSLDTDRVVIEHKLTLLEIPYGDCFHVETVYVIEPRTDAIGSPLAAKVYIGIPFSKSTMFKSKIMSATKEGVVKSTKMVLRDSRRRWMQRRLPVHPMPLVLLEVLSKAAELLPAREGVHPRGCVSSPAERHSLQQHPGWKCGTRGDFRKPACEHVWKVGAKPPAADRPTALLESRG